MRHAEATRRAAASSLALLLLLSAVAGLAFAASSASARPSQGDRVGGADWARAAYDDNNSNFNPQTQINRGNVADLQVKWTYTIPPDPFKAPFTGLSGSETTPLVVGGKVLVGAKYGSVTALNASDGDQLWSFQAPIVAEAANPGAGGPADEMLSISSYRGLVYMQGTTDCTVYGLDVKTGAVGLEIPDPCGGIPGAPAGQPYKYAGRQSPVVYERGDVAVVGEAGQSTGRGFVAGYSTTTGKLLWRWYVVPPQGGDPKWDSEDIVQLGNGATIDYGHPRGNIAPYPGDWGTTSGIFGGTSWAFDVMDQQTGIVYIGTSVPEGPDDGLYPGPELYDASLVALNAMDGRMLWYYQMTTHDAYQHEIPFQSGTLGQVNLGGRTVKVVFAGEKDGYVYAFNAATGSLLWESPALSLQENNQNDNAGNKADMTLSQGALVGKTVCPQNGVYAGTAFAYGMLYAAAQDECATPHYAGIAADGDPSYSYTTVGPVNSTLYAIDGATGRVVWKYFMPSAFQAAAVTVSGGVVYALDRAGVLYAFDAGSGKVLYSDDLGGVGQAGVSIGADDQGDMMLFVASGTSPATVTALGLPAPQHHGGDLQDPAAANAQAAETSRVLRQR